MKSAEITNQIKSNYEKEFIRLKEGKFSNRREYKKKEIISLALKIFYDYVVAPNSFDINDIDVIDGLPVLTAELNGNKVSFLVQPVFKDEALIGDSGEEDYLDFRKHEERLSHLMQFYSLKKKTTLVVCAIFIDSKANPDKEGDQIIALRNGEYLYIDYPVLALETVLYSAEACGK